MSCASQRSIVAATSTFCGPAAIRTNGPSEFLSLVLFLRESIECPVDGSVPFVQAGECSSSSSEFISPQMTKRGSSRGTAVSSRRESRIVVGFGAALIRSGTGRPL